MKYTTPAQKVSTSIPMGVYDIETIEAELRILNLPVTRPNIRRMRRAIDLHGRGAVTGGVGSVHHYGRFYSVRSQTTDEVYEVSVSHEGDYSCTCPDSAEKLNLCKHSMAVMLYDEQRRDRDMCDKWEAENAEYEADRGCVEDMCEGKRAAHLAESPSSYQVARQRIDQSASRAVRPDALTRRNGTLILRYMTPRWDRKVLARMIRKEVLDLFPKATIHRVAVDRRHITRAYISLD